MRKLPLAPVIIPHKLTPFSLVYSEVEGRDRLVKVDRQRELVQLASQLGMCVAVCATNPPHTVILTFTGAILGRTESISAKL